MRQLRRLLALSDLEVLELRDAMKREARRSAGRTGSQPNRDRNLMRDTLVKVETALEAMAAAKAASS